MNRSLKEFFEHRGEINYLYFGFFLAFVSALSLFHLFSWDPPLNRLDLYFILYAMNQAFFETCVFVLCAYLLKHWTPRSLFFSFIAASFSLLLLHFTNFTMVRLLDSTVIYLFKFFFGSGVDHAIAGLQALNMNNTMIALSVGAIVLIPLAGMGFYALTLKLGSKKPWTVSLRQICNATVIAGASLLLLDLCAYPLLPAKEHRKYEKALPLGTTFLSPQKNHIHLPSPLADFRNEEKTLEAMPLLSLDRKPNIFIFVIETFRKDYLKYAPHLSQFAQDHIQFKHAYANASCTQISWFSIFHADNPIHWASKRDHWKGGCIPLRLLKDLGYQINVYSSADLHFFHMDELIFGSKRQLAAKIEEYSENRSLQPCDRDEMAIESLKKDLTSEGNVYIVFLDSTHSEYSFPKDFPLQYEPIVEEIDYLSIGPKSPQIEKIKNRYRNSIAYIDQLMGDFFNNLKEKGLYENAIIAITGDHGEEFFEDGALFHGSHLNEVQTAVPILFKFPKEEWQPQTETATHLNMLPSILHYLTKQSDFQKLFDGKSIFSLDQPKTRITVLQNGPDSPLEFAIHDVQNSIRARFVDSEKIEIIELQGLLEPGMLSEILKKS